MNQKDAYRQKIDAQIEELTARLAVMRAQAKRFAADAKIAARGEISETDKRLAELKVCLAKLRNSGDGAWREMKEGVEAAWSDLSKAAKRAKTHFDPPGGRPRPK
jgi:hypothetical protein